MVVLYVYAIQQAHAPNDKYGTHFDAAERCQGQIFAMAERGSLAQRYGVVLEELRLEAVKQTQRQQEFHAKSHINLTSILEQNIPNPQLHLQHWQFGHDSNSQDRSQVSIDEFQISDPSALNNGANSGTPSSLIAELTSWGEFDSLVSILCVFYLSS